MIRRILLAAGLLIAPLGATAGTLALTQGVAHANTVCGTGYQENDGVLLNDITGNDNPIFADYAHTWYPAQTSSGTITTAYKTWDLCWVTQGQDGTGAYYGYMYFYNQGTGKWLGNNTTEGNENTATAGGPGPSEKYDFTCADWGNHTNTINNYYFRLTNVSTALPVQWFSSYNGLGNIEANYDPPQTDSLAVWFNQSLSLFCS